MPHHDDGTVLLGPAGERSGTRWYWVACLRVLLTQCACSSCLALARVCFWLVRAGVRACACGYKRVGADVLVFALSSVRADACRHHMFHTRVPSAQTRVSVDTNEGICINACMEAR